jgi:hypothetical protein
MRSKSRAKRSNTELNPLIGDFINTIGQTRSFGDVLLNVRITPESGRVADIGVRPKCAAS